MTAADRPSVTDDARAEAWDEGYQDGLRQGGEGEDGPRYVNPYRAAGRAETTTATVEDAARVIREAIYLTPEEPFHTLPQDAADALAEAGLLATARTRPTREQVIDALVMSPLSDTAGTDMRPFEQTADAVLALWAAQPTEAEAGARALEQAATAWAEDPDAVGDSEKDARNWLRDRADHIRKGGA